MQAFQTFTAVAAPLLRDNIDTDTIIPSSEIRSVGKTGLKAGLFAHWRYRSVQSREPNPDFILNQAPYAQARILLTGANFGCGSSREHAVWALQEYGIGAILAPGFAPIFFGNCVSNGVLAASLGRDALQALAAALASDPQANPLTLDLERSEVSAGAIGCVSFTIDADARLQLLAGLDAIDLTLRLSADIEAFETRDRVRRPWVYLDRPR
jgi:3-isopropylmalate/(R)-2-methylmalate dehydratase small subunit